MRLKRLLNVAKNLDYTGSRGGTASNPLDGKAKQPAKNAIYKATKKSTHNRMYKDEYWQGPNEIWKTFDQLGLNWQIDGSKYQKCPPAMGADPMTNCSKEWKFTIWFENNRGKQDQLNGVLVASGAGSVQDPLEKYDLILMLW